MSLKTDPLGCDVPNSEMSYGNFFIRYEHKFLRNIYSDSEIAELPQICTLQNHYVAYQKFIGICISLLTILGSHTSNEDNFDTDLKDFLQEKYPEIEELREKIENAEIKNIIKSTNRNKIPRFNLKLYAFIYDSIIEFPTSSFMYDTIATNDFFRNVHPLIKIKVHLHHSQITIKILGYSHDFCNWSVRENKSEIPMIAHNLFGFNILFFIKGYRATAWGTKDLNFGGSNLTHINYGNITGEIKFVDTLKYYQKSLGELAATLSEEETNSVKKLTIQFFNQHIYFSDIWKYLSDSQKNKILEEIISEGKGIIPYDKMADINSIFLTPENDVFFIKSEFFSDLKQKAVSDSD